MILNQKIFIRFLLTHPVWDVTKADNQGTWDVEFLLTHPVWDVTWNEDFKETNTTISTHTSRVGCDRNSVQKGEVMRAFLLTHPVWDVTNAKADFRVT